MIKEARLDEERNLQSSEPTEQETLAVLFKEYGGDKLVAQIDDHRTKADTASRKLRSLGFICDSRRDVELAYDAPQALKAAYRKAQRNDGTNKKSLKKFDLAILRVLAAETADKAREIAESVIT